MAMDNRKKKEETKNKRRWKSMKWKEQKNVRMQGGEIGEKMTQAGRQKCGRIKSQAKWQEQ